jgi:hypothetical protein
MRKLTKLISKPVKFQIHWQTKKLQYLTNTKDQIPSEYQCSVVYKFTCPACNSCYIGKTDRNLLTRIIEHSKSNASEIFQHTQHCTGFGHVHDLLNLPDTLSNNSPIDLYHVLLANTKIIDRDKHWALLLFKEALAIRRGSPELNHGLKASKQLVLFH